MRNLLSRRPSTELAPNDVFSPLQNIRDTMDGMFADLFNQMGPGLPALNSTTNWSPAINMHQEGDNLVIECMVPGVDKNQLQITCDRGVLTIQGELKQNQERKEHDFLRREFFHGTFRRQVSLPHDVDPSSIKASLKNGLLRLLIPQPEEARQQRVNIAIE